MTTIANFGSSCPTPHASGDRVLLAHGEGARLTRRLVREILLPAFDNPILSSLADGAILPALNTGTVMTTDSFVVSPLIFPGGDIGKLAIHGTVNDLAVCGAKPLFLSIALILEEGLPLNLLRRIVGSMSDAARDCGVQVVTGDTKVVPRGAADGMFVTTTGLGSLPSDVMLGTYRICAGDRVLVSGTIGDHGIAILAAREGLDLESTLQSDTAPLYELVQSLLACGADVHFLRDPTRGGVSAVLHEIAEASQLSIIVDEAMIPLSEPVRGVCEILGLDPLYVANEGKLVVIVAPHNADQALAALHSHPLGVRAAIIGEVAAASHSEVHIRGLLGALRVLDEPTGALLPRIC
jgi:hydrogenase expression/formation protein HypE